MRAWFGGALGLALGAAGCLGAPAPTTDWRSSVPECQAPRGERGMALLAPGSRELHGFTLYVTEARSESPAGRVFVLNVHGPGVRRTIGGPGDVCPSRPAPTDPCTSIGVDELAHDVHVRLIDGGLDGSNVYVDRVRIHDWAEVDRAAVAVADALRAWRIASPYAVDVGPMSCDVVEVAR